MLARIEQPDDRNDRNLSRDHLVTRSMQLERIYGEPYGPSLAKETDRITAHYRAFIEAAPFFALASGGPDGLRLLAARRCARLRARARREDAADPGPAGQQPHRHAAQHPADPRVALLFLIPGCGETIRVNGRAAISTDPALAQSFIVNGKAPRAVIVVTVERVYFQCAKAIVRSKLWDASRHVDRKSLPSAGTILAELTDGKLGGEAHDRAAPERLKATLY